MSIPTSFIWGVPPLRGSAQSSQMVLVPCLGIRGRGGGWGLRAEGLKQEERTSLLRIMRWDVKKNSWMLHAATIDFIITLYMPYSEQRGQCPSTGNIENSPPPPDFLITCTNEVQLNRFWKPINNRSWGGEGQHTSIITRNISVVHGFLLWVSQQQHTSCSKFFIPGNFCFCFAFGYGNVC